MIQRTTFRLVLRIAALVVFVAALLWVGHTVREAIGFEVLPHTEAAAFRMILISLLTYALLLALPFVPGAEIGLALLALFGASIAPMIYVATLTGLSLAYLMGRLIPAQSTCGLLKRIGFLRLASLIEAADQDPDRRGSLDQIAAQTSGRVAARLARHRHLALAVLLNLPGNAILGGGGGIAMMAGLSRTISPLGFLATIIVAVAPVPLLTMFLDAAPSWLSP